MPKDPALQAALYVFAAVVAIVLIAVVGIFVIPVVIVIVIGVIIYNMSNRAPRPIRFDLNELYLSAINQAKSVPDEDTFSQDFVKQAFLPYQNDAPPNDVCDELLTAACALYVKEAFSKIESPPVSPDDVQRAQYKERLVAHLRKVDAYPVFLKSLVESTRTLIDALPEAARGRDMYADAEADVAGNAAQNAIVPLASLLRDKQIITDFVLPFYNEEAKKAGLFIGLKDRLDETLHDISRVPFTPATRNLGKLIMPEQQDGNFQEVAARYLKDTPLEDIFTARVPFAVPLSRRLEHTAIVAGTGHGKTQLLQQIIATDLESADSPGMVVIDSTGAMVKRIQRLAVFSDRLRDRILIIDPEDDPVPALNMFDVSNPRLQTYGRAVREEVETEIIGLFNYVFESLASELTGRMSTTFSFIVRLMLSIPGSTIHTLRELLEDDTDAFAPHIAKLDATAQAFFKNHFYSRPFRTTRASIAQRLYGIIQVPAFERMFSSTNRLDMYEELQRGTIILINTSTRLLKEDASPLFGRYMIARTLAAVFERAAIPENERRPAFLFVDEAAPYFDDTFEAMLTRVRQFKLGVVIAFQHLEQTSEKLRSAIASNTSVKMAGGLGYSDSRWLSREMHTTPEFLQAQKRDPRDPPAYTHFACHVRNYTDTAVSLKVPIGTLEAMPRMTDAEHDALRERNRARVSNPLPQTEAKAPVEKKPEPFTPSAPQRAPEKPPEPDSGTEAATDWR